MATGKQSKPQDKHALLLIERQYLDLQPHAAKHDSTARVTLKASVSDVTSEYAVTYTLWSVVSQWMQWSTRHEIAYT